MRGERDDLFPVLYISNTDGDKDKHKDNGGPSHRNKMPLFGSETASRSNMQAFKSLWCSSSTNVGSEKRKGRPIFATMNEGPYSGELYISPGDEHNFPLIQTKILYPRDVMNTSPFLQRKTIYFGDEHTSTSLPRKTEDAFFQRNTLSPRDEHTSAFIQQTKCLSPEDEHTSTFRTPNYINIKNNQTVDRMKSSWGDEMSSSTYPYSSPSLIHHDRESKAVKKDEFPNTSIPGLDLTTDEVVKVIGPRLFHEARKTMIHQQKMFSWQMFELHRLITVQRHIARSPETFHPTKPAIKFPPMNKLLYVSPLDTSSSSPKTKTDAPKSDPGLPLPNPGPWCFPPPPGNQWLIPVRSPSEGLVYKPYPGPCFPTASLMNPVYGNYGPMSSGGPYIGCYNPEVGQSYFPHYPMNASSEVKAGEVDKSSFKLVFDLHKQKDSERPEWLERDELSLFPTTPLSSVDVSKEKKGQVIKVVPYSRDSAPASAARILQSLQEGRRRRNKE